MTAVAAGPIAAAVRAARECAQPAFISVLDDGPLESFEVGDGPLAGVPFAVKDNIDVAGVPTTAACPALTTPATAHATAVERLLAAGAVPIAKTNMDQFATGLVGTRSPYGACHSVYSPAHVSGGSSSGSAVAVASGIVPLALGTDTAGSGRVPAAFNGLVGFKPSRGLVPNTGLLPASPSLDCITTFTRTVRDARVAFEALVGGDAADPFSRALPVVPPPGIAQTMRVIGVPAAPLDLDGPHAEAWGAAVSHAASVAHVVPVDVTSFLAAAQLLYGSALVAERLAAFGALLETDGPHLDSVVRSIVLGASRFSAAEAFAGLADLQRLRALALPVFERVDALLLPVTPGHPTLAEVTASPVQVNARLGTYTNMVNLLDLCAVAVPAGARPDGLPFGVQLIAPAFADRPLLDLGARWCGESVPAPASRTMLAVAGAHLTGHPRNVDLVSLGGRLAFRARTGPGYRMYEVPGPFARPGLVAGDGPAGGIEIEVWDVPSFAVDLLRPTIAPPLLLGPLVLDDGREVLGFVAEPSAADPTRDITQYGGWRAYLALGADESG